MHSLMTLAVTVILYNCRCVAIGIRGCECVTFDDTYNKEYGIFTSPNFPTQYDDNIDCLLYTFIGSSEQIVKLSFVSFDVQKGSLSSTSSASSTSSDCTTGDFVKLFLNLGEGTVGISERSQYDTILCGKSLDKSQMTHFSVGHLLVFEFHSDSINANNKGFSGTFHFINKSNFVSDGDLLSGAQCDYQFVRLSIDNKKSGKLYSPNYPSYYPPNSNCAYHFFAKYNEKVKVLFESIQLSHSELSCRYSSDVILVYDGKNSRSPLIAQLCNHVLFAQIISSGPDLYIEFKSGARKPEGNGFKASYEFQTNDYNNSQSTQTVSEITATYTTTASKTTIATPLPSTAIPVANVVQIPRTEPDESVFSKDETTESTETPYECDQWFSSDTEKNGTFTSPNFPDPYPANVHCTYHFNGRGKERVQISFTHFDLNKPPKTSRDCESTDVILVFININGQKEQIDNFCGPELPAQIMSNGPTLTVEFKSLPTSHNGKGFRAIYRFVTNFGITSGKPDSQSVCGFIFNSTEVNNGTIISPNYPGLYPRDTECHYFFYGYASERVHITFTFFDVEGVTPCTTETASDYVELSNYRTVDLEIPRHCGLKRPKVIESDGNFFRVTFKSNDRFDGNGFDAFYQFKSQEDPSTVKIQRGMSGCAQCVAHLTLMMSLIVITLLFKNVFVSQQINHILK